MKTLPKTFNRRGVLYTQHKRCGDVVLFALRYSTVAPIIGFDVCRLTVRKGRMINGKTLPTAEQMPSGRDYGWRAWSFCKLETARAKYSELLGDKK